MWKLISEGKGSGVSTPRRSEWKAYAKPAFDPEGPVQF